MPLDIHTSAIDAAVAAHRADTAHVWITFTPSSSNPDTSPYELCSRCGRPKTAVRNPNYGQTTTEPEFLACRGFV